MADDMLARLLGAARWGAALAVATTSGCGSSGDGGTLGGALSDASGEGGGLPTDPYPDPGGCSGPVYDGGYYGQCCEKVGCGTPDAGVCPSAAGSPLYGWVSSFPPGSGTCACGTTTGPYAPRDPSTEGPCCYVFGSITCEGRPLVVRGEARLAPLVARADWGSARRDGRG